jgi:O-methyltransferase involved in polyketide biosynthesis
MQFSIVWQQTLILATKVTIDLDFLGERSLQQELAEADFAAEKPSLFVAEGLIMYLGPEGILSSSSVRAKTDEN